MSNKNNYKLDYNKYNDIPESFNDRKEYIFNKLNIKEKDIEIINKNILHIKKQRQKTKQKVQMTFYIKPEGISRPRKGKWGFYVPNIQKFYECMDDYLEQHKEMAKLNIFSECKIDLKYYLPIPSDMRKHEKVLAEFKYIKPIKKPDWDNLGKGSDMLHRIWLDDSLVSDARVRKYYSFKPRIEVTIIYYNQHCNSYHELCIKKIGGKKNGKDK